MYTFTKKAWVAFWWQFHTKTWLRLLTIDLIIKTLLPLTISSDMCCASLKQLDLDLTQNRGTWHERAFKASRLDLRLLTWNAVCRSAFKHLNSALFSPGLTGVCQLPDRWMIPSQLDLIQLSIRFYNFQTALLSFLLLPSFYVSSHLRVTAAAELSVSLSCHTAGSRPVRQTPCRRFYWLTWQRRFKELPMSHELKMGWWMEVMKKM